MLQPNCKPAGLPHPVSRRRYDAERDPATPSSRTLVHRYGSWANVCRHANHPAIGTSNRLPKQRRRSSSKKPHKYSRIEAVQALRECANELQRPPSRNTRHPRRSRTRNRRRSDRKSRTHPLGSKRPQLERTSAEAWPRTTPRSSLGESSTRWPPSGLLRLAPPS